MSGHLYELTCEAFSERLFSKAPVPGGGGAAAFIGALGVSLGAMAGNLTIGKKKYAAFEADLVRMTGRAEELRKDFLQLIDQDAEVFEPLSKAYSIPKDQPGRAEILREVTIAATKVPYRMMELCCEAIDLLEEMHEKCSRLLISDVGCGASAARAALECASLNVFINTRTLREDPEAIQMQEGAERMLREYREKAQRVADSVFAVLK